MKSDGGGPSAHPRIDVALETSGVCNGWEDSPDGYPQGDPYDWWRRHDEYEDDGR